MKGVLAVIGIVGCVSSVSAGTIKVGYNTINGGAKYPSCHITFVAGPADQIAGYRAAAAQKFEKVDEAKVEEIKQADLVEFRAVLMQGDLECARNSGVPRRIVLTQKGAKEPVLSIDIEPSPVTLGNAMGATFTAAQGLGKVKRTDLAPLAGKDLDFYLIYQGRETFKDKWKSGYVAQIMGPAKDY